VDRAAGGVAAQRLQVERLGDNPLAGEGGVTVSSTGTAMMSKVASDAAASGRAERRNA